MNYGYFTKPTYITHWGGVKDCLNQPPVGSLKKRLQHLLMIQVALDPTFPAKWSPLPGNLASQISPRPFPFKKACVVVRYMWGPFQIYNSFTWKQTSFCQKNNAKLCCNPMWPMFIGTSCFFIMGSFYGNVGSPLPGSLQCSSTKKKIHWFTLLFLNRTTIL